MCLQQWCEVTGSRGCQRLFHTTAGYNTFPTHYFYIIISYIKEIIYKKFDLFHLLRTTLHNNSAASKPEAKQGEFRQEGKSLKIINQHWLQHCWIPQKHSDICALIVHQQAQHGWQYFKTEWYRGGFQQRSGEKEICAASKLEQKYIYFLFIYFFLH